MSTNTFFSRAAGFVALAVLSAGLALGQNTQITGRVIGLDGKPVKDAEIRIERKDIKANYKTKSNGKGEFIHAGLPIGQFDVSLFINGKSIQTMGVATHLSEPTEVIFDMKKSADQSAALEKAAATGQLTEEQTRSLSPEQKAALEKQAKERAAVLQKNKALNEAFNLGMTAMQNKQYDAAVEQFVKASEMDPKQDVVWGNLADAYLNQGRAKTGAEQEALFAKSLESYAKAIELKPDDPGYHNNYALGLAQAKKIKEAEDELTKAAALDPTKAATYYYNLGAVLTNINQLDAGGEAFKKAIAADKSHADAQYQYGIYLTSRASTTPDGKTVFPPGTKEAFQAYVDLKPTGPNADSARAMLSAMDATVQTNYQNPDAQKKGAKKGGK